MKLSRRNFGLLAAAGAVVPTGEPLKAQAADATMLTTTLTPFGSERAGNADGSIPAWTGGFTTPPAGWQPGQSMPEFFADEQPILVIDSSNMAAHSDKLTDGVMAMMTKYGFSIKVYPTHRTQAMPESVYENIAKNITRARLADPANPQLGMVGGFAGIPFPIPDTSNPLAAGAQIIINHRARWLGFAFHSTFYAYVVSNGRLTLTDKSTEQHDFPYYNNPALPTTSHRSLVELLGPADLVGEQLIVVNYLDSTETQSWELLQGQGRVRKAPEFSFDTPSGFAGGICNYDEYQGFYGQLIQYDWRYIEKKEMYIPYHNNGMYLAPVEDVLKEHFPNPDVVRWELHRVWVVEATVRSDARNVLARRRFYVDEDTWTIGTSDAWDGNNNLYHVGMSYNNLRPDLPGISCWGYNAVFNLQTGDYVIPSGQYNEKAAPSLVYTNSYPDSYFDPLHMAANAQY
jgi:hypothetical protein